MSHESTLEQLPYRRLENPGIMRMLSLALLVLGAIALVAAFMGDAPRAWRAYYFNWLYFTSLAQGAVVLAIAVTITRGLWSRPIRRISLAFVTFMPIAYVLVIPILLFGNSHIWPWVDHPASMQAGKGVYLNMPFLSARTLLLMGVLVILDLVFAYWALRPDLGRLRDKVPDSLRPLYNRLSKDWQGEDAEDLRAYKKIAVLGPVAAAFWAVSFGVLAWDFVMSLEPHWFSTMIGPYFFMAGFLGGIAATAVCCALYVTKYNQGDIIESSNFHDLGKMTFGFCVFWAYLFYAQFITIWYGLLPIEQDWLVHRFGMPYQRGMTFVFFCLFVLPFFGLLGAAPKKRPQILAFFTSIVLIGLWVERYMMVYPSLYIDAPDMPLGWQEFGALLFFAGILITGILWFANRFPIFQMWQPKSEVELMGVEPEASTAA